MSSSFPLRVSRAPLLVRAAIVNKSPHAISFEDRRRGSQRRQTTDFTPEKERLIMKSRKLVFIIFCTTLVLPLLLAAQRSDRRGGHLRYRLVDFGTLGGPISYGSVNGNGAQLL